MESNKETIRQETLEMEIIVQLDKDMVEQQINTKLSDKEWNVFIDNGDEFENYLYDQIMDIPFQEYVLGECIESFVDDFLQDKEW